MKHALLATLSCLLILSAAPSRATATKVTFREALKKRFIAVEGQGAGGYTGQCLNLCITNLTANELDVYVEPATAFKPQDKARQPLWAVGDEHLTVAAKGHVERKLNAFCGNSNAASPRSGMRYDFWQTGDRKMVGLMKHIRKQGLYNGLGQRAVWTLTNNHDVHTIFDYSSMQASRQLADYTAALKGCRPPEYFIPSMISDGSNNQPVFVSDNSRAIVDIPWTKESYRNMHIRIYRQDGSLFKEVTGGQQSSADGHLMRISFDTREMPEGLYYVNLKDDDNYLWASRTVRLGDPCKSGGCDSCGL